MPDFKVLSQHIKLMDSTHMHMVTFVDLDNQVPEPPTDPNKVYMVGGKKFGVPVFQIKQRAGGELFPNTDACWFSKNETDQSVKLHCIISVMRNEPDVSPFRIRNPKITVSFNTGSKQIDKAMTITESPMVDAANVLQDLHAEAGITSDEIKDLIITLKNAGTPVMFTFTVTAELWYQIDKSESLPTIKVPASVGGRRILMNPALSAKLAASTVRYKPVSRLGARSALMTRAKAARPAPAPTPTTPQKIDLSNKVIVQYSKEDTSVFGALSAELAANTFQWETANIVKEGGVSYRIYYRPTIQPDEFFFLPQVFRIKAKEKDGEPRISIAMVAGTDPNDMLAYRINISVTLVPYYNPKAKRDLFLRLRELSKGTIQSCGLRLGGYGAVSFKLREAYSGDNAVLRGRIQDAIESIDPVNGFTLVIDCSLESFDFFKREMLDGEWIIGDIQFELKAEGTEGTPSTPIASIPVELDMRKLTGYPINTTILTEEQSITIPPAEEGGQEETTTVTTITGFQLENPNQYPLMVGGAETALLSKIGEVVYHSDYVMTNNGNWPVTIGPKSAAAVQIVNDADPNQEGVIWTQLWCEPHGVSAGLDADALLSKVIDYATGDPQVWELQVSCPLFERWAELDDTMKAPFKQVHRLLVEIKNESGEVSAVQLSVQQPIGKIKMAKTISQILKSQQLSGRKYQYRVGTEYIVDPIKWTDWSDPESTAANFLSVQPYRTTA